ncbi:penicillin-binding protein 1C [Chryseosolibacter indicus]|uniref:peptidoglycan glycosyltransferase n=1 Tax=Chryseosolibacter indicus TaxID=2782351 RepID=A0ABS5VMQ7_9BACT|nr:penicillin-binding protein 1C [Chryseosolibacter indicus]MBT1702735.1 penicillin-binding protein 1C [Chryseosolibacter indicus]
MVYRIQSAIIGAISGIKKWILLTSILIIFYWFSLSKTLFNDPYSTVLQSKDGQLLSASIARDGQWRFPETDTLPSKFIDALITFEDKRFYNHPGIDLLSLARAFKQNIKAGKVVSGGSTISMQVIRLSRKGQSRNVMEKLIEIILATRLEIRYSKEEILALYASHAPFGGNVVGIEAACWRYFSTTPNDLSWSQAALLAVLPNAPSLIHPGKNRKTLKLKRDTLLDKLERANKIDKLTCSLAKDEPLPDSPYPLPRFAKHLLTRVAKDKFAEKKTTSTIDYSLQLRVEEILQLHHQRLSANEIHNAAAIVIDVNTGSILAYVGNIDGKQRHENDVDIINSPRSTGSILKPFLYAAMLDEGKILPKSLLPDIPVLINGFSPKNFSHAYDGAVPADKALIRSLNIPAVNMLKDYRYEKFHTLLKNMGMNTLTKAPDHYGLSLILGGAEGTLWDITGIYASMARTLNNYFEHPGAHRYLKSDFHAPYYLKSQQDSVKRDLELTSWLSAASIYSTFEALKEVYRPGEETGWRYFHNAKKIAWKTGTSFGFRDGWAVGVTPRYTVGVWVGNADGEGRPGLTGTDAAAPVMFDIFAQLPQNKWFDFPKPEMHEVTTCGISGFRASPLCTPTDTIWVVKQGLSSSSCPYHKMVHLTKDQKYQVHDGCMALQNITHLSWFILPPIQEYYYKAATISYKALPPFRTGCETGKANSTMDMIYPKENTKIYIPKEIDGNAGSSIFELAHRNPNTTVYWHLDGNFLGVTKKTHHFPINPKKGKHTLVVVDEDGESLKREFEVLSKGVGD